MKKGINLTTIAILLTVCLSVLAGRVLSSPQAAAEAFQPFHQSSTKLRNDGYKMVSVQENPIMFIMAPEGDHLWGHITYTMTKKPFEGSLQTEIVTMTVTVNWKDRKGGYTGSSMTESHTTVY